MAQKEDLQSMVLEHIRIINDGTTMPLNVQQELLANDLQLATEKIGAENIIAITNMMGTLTKYIADSLAIEMHKMGYRAIKGEEQCQEKG